MTNQMEPTAHVMAELTTAMDLHYEGTEPGDYAYDLGPAIVKNGAMQAVLTVIAPTGDETEFVVTVAPREEPRTMDDFEARYNRAAEAEAAERNTARSPRSQTMSTPQAVKSITARLIAAGWTRLEESGGDCAMSSATVGYCVKSARWAERSGSRPMCAQHAASLIEGRRTR